MFFPSYSTNWACPHISINSFSLCGISFSVKLFVSYSSEKEFGGFLNYPSKDRWEYYSTLFFFLEYFPNNSQSFGVF